MKPIILAFILSLATLAIAQVSTPKRIRSDLKVYGLVEMPSAEIGGQPFTGPHVAELTGGGLTSLHSHEGLIGKVTGSVQVLYHTWSIPSGTTETQSELPVINKRIAAALLTIDGREFPFEDGTVRAEDDRGFIAEPYPGESRGTHGIIRLKMDYPWLPNEDGSMKYHTASLVAWLVDPEPLTTEGLYFPESVLRLEPVSGSIDELNPYFYFGLSSLGFLRP